jgi:uncharacterized Fe-S cluster protein YjdI
VSAREYKSGDIIVYFEPRLCIHSGHCVRGLPRVFDRNRTPWVQPENADADSIAHVVEKCPTGALHYKRLDGGADESADEQIGITVIPGGPLYLRGKIEIKNSKGEVIRKDTRFALCRCGKSANKPFCDGSHTGEKFE